MSLHEEQDRRQDVDGEGKAFVIDAAGSARMMPGLLAEK